MKFKDLKRFKNFNIVIKGECSFLLIRDILQILVDLVIIDIEFSFNWGEKFNKEYTMTDYSVVKDGEEIVPVFEVIAEELGDNTVEVLVKIKHKKREE